METLVVTNKSFIPSIEVNMNDATIRAFNLMKGKSVAGKRFNYEAVKLNDNYAILVSIYSIMHTAIIVQPEANGVNIYKLYLDGNINLKLTIAYDEMVTSTLEEEVYTSIALAIIRGIENQVTILGDDVE